MFGTNLECQIKAVKVKVTEKDGRVVRRCRVQLVHEFTSDIAHELGREAVQLRKSLADLAVLKAELPITNIAALGAFTAEGAACRIGRMVGIKAVATAPKEGEDGAQIAFEFEFAWQEDAWVFLGRYCAAVADVVLTKAQMPLPYAGDAANN